MNFEALEEHETSTGNSPSWSIRSAKYADRFSGCIRAERVELIEFQQSKSASSLPSSRPRTPAFPYRSAKECLSSAVGRRTTGRGRSRVVRRNRRPVDLSSEKTRTLHSNCRGRGFVTEIGGRPPKFRGSISKRTEEMGRARYSHIEAGGLGECRPSRPTGRN